MEKQELLEKRLAPLLEIVLDENFENDDLQSINFKSILISLAVSISTHYITESIDKCYEIFKEEVLPILVEANNLDVDEEHAKDIFVVSYNTMFDACIDKKKLVG